MVVSFGLAWKSGQAVTNGFVSLIGWLTASVSDTTMALVEDSSLLRSRQVDMGNSGSRLSRHLHDHPSWVDLGLPALTVVFGMQSVRVLFSLASYLLRDTFHWDAQYIGALGFAIFSTAFLWALLRRLLGLRLMLIATAGGLGALRLAMQAWSGDPLVDFVLASGAVILFVLFLPAYLGYSRGRQEASHGFALGLLLGLSVDLALHGAYTTYDLGWDDGIDTLLVIGVLVALQLALLWGLLAQAVDPEMERESEDARQGTWRQVLPWLGLGPFLFLQLLVFQNLARLVALTEWSFPSAYAWALFSHAAGVAAGLWALNSGRRVPSGPLRLLPERFSLRR